MKKHVYTFLISLGLIVLLSACKPISDQETVTTETVTITEIEEPTSEEFTNDGEKITVFRISEKACNKWWGDTTGEVKRLIERGEDIQLEDDFVSVVDKKTYVELKMSESDIDTCRKRMFDTLGVGPSNKLEKDAFFYYNEEYNKMVAYVSKKVNTDALFEIGGIHACLTTLQMLEGVDSDEWSVNITIINSDTGNVVIEMDMGLDRSEEYKLTADDWR